MSYSTTFPHISPDINADPTVQFIGDVYIGKSCILEKNVVVDGSKGRVVIKDNCKIGSATLIKTEQERMIISANTEIGKDCTIMSSIGQNCKIGDNVIIGENKEIPDNSKIEAGTQMS